MGDRQMLVRATAPVVESCHEYDSVMVVNTYFELHGIATEWKVIVVVYERVPALQVGAILKSHQE